jgi:chromatin remodeling complex protein RSC6
VSKEINRYIREHSLQDKTNGRKIIPDDKLTTLLKLKEGDELTYFNLQRFMKHHFIKETPVVAV